MASLITVNGQDLSSYGVSLVSYNTGAPEIANTYQSTNTSFFPALLDHQIGLRPLTVVLEFSAEERSTATKNLSLVSALVQSKCELLLPDGFYYSCILTGISEPEESMETMFDVTFSFAALRHSALQTLALASGGGNITCMGNLPAECRICFTPTSNGSVSVFGISLDGLDTGKQVVIDGIGKTITQDGVNIWDKSNMVSFPRLTPGVNSVRISPALPLTVTYYPLWL